MDYITIFNPIPWPEVGVSVLQAVTLYIIVLFGLELIGRRVFAEKGPQDLIVLLLVAEACDLGMAHEAAGYWGTFFSVVTIILLGGVTERIPFLRKTIDEKPVMLYGNGRLYKKRLADHLIDECDLDETARCYGLASYKQFQSIYLEGNGSMTGVLNVRPAGPLRKKKNKKKSGN